MMKFSQLQVIVALASLGAIVAPSQAGVVTFGSGGNQFTMNFTTIGDPGNLADTTGTPNPAGSVGYTYEIGTYEVSEDMINKYNANFGTANGLVITQDSRGADKPTTGVTWNEAARFVNWLNTNTGNVAAYKFTTSGVNDNIALWQAGDAGYDASNPYRNSLAKYVLPSYNEWYKAAYYDPDKNGGSGGYWKYTTGSDTAPTAVASGTSAGTAVFDQDFLQGPADVTLAGGLSPYGVMGLGGNVWEFEESSYDLANSSGSSDRGVRGGAWYNPFFSMYFQVRNYDTDPGDDYEMGTIGFRVVSLDSTPSVVPEPSMMVIGSILGIGGLIAKRRMKKQTV